MAGRRGAGRAAAGVLGFGAAGVLAYALGPWVVPLRIYEGPLLQNATGAAVSVTWYTTRPGACRFVLISESGRRGVAVSRAGRRCRVRVGGLKPGRSYGYQILGGGRVLAESRLRCAVPAGGSFGFVVFGDSGRGGRVQYLLAREMVSAAPDFVLHTGDLVYGRGQRRRYADRFFAPYRALLGQVSFWPCLGNHDLAGPRGDAPYREVFELPENGPADLPAERNYWFDYGGARVAVIDSNLGEGQLRDAVAPWLRKVMGVAGVRWRFAALHHPPFSAGQRAPSEPVRRALVPVFEATGVDIVFAGHSHMYQRTLPLRGGVVAGEGAGVVYVVTGAGGGRLYKARPPEERPEYLAALNDEFHSFTLVRVEGRKLSLRQIALGGRELDRWELRKPGRGGAGEGLSDGGR